MPATRKLGKFLKPYWQWAVLAPLMMVLEVAMDLLQPRLIQHIIDAGIATGNMGIVTQTAAWMVVVAVIGLGGGVGCAIYAIHIRAICIVTSYAYPHAICIHARFHTT